jgi:hypothetical protein
MLSKVQKTDVAKAQVLEDKPYLARIVTIIALLIMLFGVTHTLTPSVAKAYSCPDAIPCYGRNDWPGNTAGVSFQVSVASLSCCQGNGGVVTNEVWLVDCDPYAFFGLGCGQAHWVEEGYVKYDGDVERYFWGDSRPRDNGGVNYWPLDQVPSGDYGNFTYMSITEYGEPSGTFLVYLDSNNVLSINYSTSNTMVPSDIELGQELHGTCCASANRAYFRSNRWQDSSGNWHYQTVDGTVHSDNPPYSGWSVTPSNSSTGGQLWTNCC